MSENTPQVIEAHVLASLTGSNAILSITADIELLLGFSSDDFLTGKVSLKSRIHADDQDIADDLFSAGIDQPSGTFNLRFRQANGRIRCVKGHYTKEPDASGTDVLLELLLQDAKSLRKSQGDEPIMTNFMAMMENTDDYIYFKDRNHVFTGASQTLVEVTESARHWTELIGLTDYDVFAEEYADIYYRLEKQVFAGVHVVHEIQETLDQNGNKGWVDNRKYPIKNTGGELIGLFGIVRDVTEYRLTEQALRTSEEFQTIAGLGSYVLDISSGSWKGSDSLDQLLGISEAYERSLDGWVALIHPDDCTVIDDHVRSEVFGQGNVLDKEYRIIRHADQSERWVRGLWKLEFDAQGRPLKMRGTLQDVTESRQGSLAEQRAILGSLLVGIVTVRQRKIVWANPAFETMFGYGTGEVVGMPTRQFYVDEAGYQAVGAIYADIGKDDVVHTQHEFVRKDGRHIWVDMSAAQPHKETGESLWTFIDITERKLAENELRIAATAFESQEGMMVTDANTVILRTNRAFTAITGYSAEDVAGKLPSILSSGRHDAAFYAAMWESIDRTGSWGGEIWNRRKNGEIYPQQLTITAVKDSAGIVTSYVSTFIDIAQRKAAEDEIQNLAFYDTLTRLPNRRLLFDCLKQVLASSVRSGSQGALLIIDLDDFKTLNDTLGHDIGDLLLQQVAERLTSNVRECDIVARLGGDEFVVMLVGLSGQDLEAATQAETVGKKILTILSQPYQIASYGCYSTSSIGATVFNGHKSTMDELLKQADIAMYQAKKGGRNTLRFFDPQMQVTINARVSMEGELRKALEQRQFHLYYQVQVDSSGRPLGAEALIRWIHPERGLVSPAQFIPLAEDTGLILPIGQWVLETACAQLQVWQQDARTRDLTLSVNVSAKQFYQADFAVQVQAAVQSHAINPMRLKLELTESMLLERIDDTIATMNALKEIGVRFSLDDFGTGYSSLQYLKRLPLYQLKIDQSFVRDIAVDSSDQAIVRTIIAMAQTMNLNVIAEGVETEEQRQLLLNNGCSTYQGYLFSKPVPIEQFEAALMQE
jgi:diguanylate cyclase (GGDEF)-like protein/PAS domain S-box-containing protein